MPIWSDKLQFKHARSLDLAETLFVKLSKETFSRNLVRTSHRNALRIPRTACETTRSEDLRDGEPPGSYR